MTEMEGQRRKGSPQQKEGMAAAMRVGWWVFVVLLALAITEYVIFLVLEQNLPVMIVMNLADAGLILWYFMHVRRLWRGQEA